MTTIEVEGQSAVRNATPSAQPVNPTRIDLQPSLTWLRGGGGLHGWRRRRLRVGGTLIQGEQQHGQGYERPERLVAQALPAPHVVAGNLH